ASNRHYRFPPRGVETMCEQLQRSDRIVNQEQTILDALQIRIAGDMIRTCNSSNCATPERITDKAMSIDEFAIKTGAGVVLLRKRKKQFARAYRTRVDGIISNLFVKYLSADA